MQRGFTPVKLTDITHKGCQRMLHCRHACHAAPGRGPLLCVCRTVILDEQSHQAGLTGISVHQPRDNNTMQLFTLFSVIRATTQQLPILAKACICMHATVHKQPKPCHDWSRISNQQMLHVNPITMKVDCLHHILIMQSTANRLHQRNLLAVPCDSKP